MAYNEEDPRDRVGEFLDKLQTDLKWVVENSEDVLVGYSQEFYGNLYSAFEEVGMMFDRARRSLSNQEEVTFDDLSEHGLVGSQLDLKLGAVESHREAVKIIQDNEDEIRQLEDPIRVKLIGNVLRSYFRKLERFLESVLDAIGAPGAIAEFKDLIEQSIST